MADDPKDWGATPVAQTPPPEGGPAAWGAEPVQEPEGIPPAFLDRVAAGSALQKTLGQKGIVGGIQAFGSGFTEGFGDEPLGWSPEHVERLRELGIYRDPANGRGGPLRLFNESVMQPAGVLGDLLMRSASGVAYGLSGTFGQLIEDAHGALGNPEEARNEALNFINRSLLRGDTDFARPEDSPTGPRDQVVGGLPRKDDFKAAANVVSGGPPPDNIVEDNLRELWRSSGIHPAEAAADARNDNFLKGQLTTKPYNLPDRGDVGQVVNSVAPPAPRSTLALTGDPRIDRILESDVTRDVVDNPIVNRNYRVPYTAGGSVPLDDPTMFIDKSFPRSFTVNGITFDPADPFAVHENVEQHTMDLLTKGGMDDATAYKVAHFEFAEKAEGAWYDAHGINKEEAEKAYAPYMAQIQKEGGADFPPNLYKRPYPHDEPAAAAGEAIAEPKPTKAEISAAHAILDKHFAELDQSPQRALGAEATTDTFPPIERQPLQPPGSLSAAVARAGERFYDMGRDLQMKIAPMATGTSESMAAAKDFANSLRRNRLEWSRLDDHIYKNFDRAQRERIYNAMDEESVLRQQGKTSEGAGIATLPLKERLLAYNLQMRAQITWGRMRDLGMVEGDGLPFYTPRMIYNAATATDKDGVMAPNRMPSPIGRNLRTTVANLLHRKHLLAEETEAAAKVKYGEGAELVRDIRVMPMALAHMEDAIAGRQLINTIRDIGRRTNQDTVAEGFKPSEGKWFTVDHPAFRTWRNEPKSIEIPAQSTTVSSTHEMGIDPGLQAGLERVAQELGVSIRQPLRGQDPYLKADPTTLGYTSRTGSDVVSTFGNAQTTLEHELGHKIDFQYGLSHTIHAENPTAWRELGELALHRVNSSYRVAIRAQPDFIKKLSELHHTGEGSSYADYLLNGEERIANLLHAYWYTPKLLQKVAPNASKWFEGFLERSPDRLKQAIKSVEPSLGSETRRLQEQTSVMSNPVKISMDQWKQVPIYVRGDFEGPLKAVLSEKNGALYSAAMALKGKTMGLIMNSPMIHNLVEFGRAFPAMPGKFLTRRVYSVGNAAKNDAGQMTEAVNAGLVPIGHRFFNQDISSIMEEPNLAPGRSLTAQVAGFVPGIFDPAAGVAVKDAIDKAGNFWHNTLLWDKVANLQMGLYVNFRDDLRAKGVDPQTSARIAAHFANSYAGSLPTEAMSNNARKIANMLMFSRTFTLGNLGVFKDAVTGLPKDVMAQIERDMGEVDPKAAGYAKALARRKAASVLMMDIGLFYVTNSVLQSAINVMRGDDTLDQEEQGYATRMSAALQRIEEHPLETITPLSLVGGAIGATRGPLGAVVGTAIGTGISQLKYLSSTYSNESGRQDRVKVGYAKDGTAIYARNAFGKIGEEFMNYTTSPMDMLLKKQSTVARPAWQIINNDAGFGHKIYDPDPASRKWWQTMWQVGKYFGESQTPAGQAEALWDLVHGDGDEKVNALHAFGPLAGVTFSKGAPGGPPVGEYYHAKDQFQYRLDAALPDIRKQILAGDTAGALDRMKELGVPPGLQKWYLKTTMNPATRLSGRALRDFYNYATPEERDRMEKYGRPTP